MPSERTTRLTKWVCYLVLVDKNAGTKPTKDTEKYLSTSPYDRARATRHHKAKQGWYGFSSPSNLTVKIIQQDLHCSLCWSEKDAYGKLTSAELDI